LISTNHDLAGRAERNKVSAPARRQRQFADHAIAERVQTARGTAGNRERGRRLPPVERRAHGF
jgi:hypothetical protein